MSIYDVDVDDVYRICVNVFSGYVQVVCIGLWCVDNPYEGEYSSVDALPKWIQGKVAVLMTVATLEKVWGVGRRVSDNTFYIHGSPLGSLREASGRDYPLDAHISEGGADK